MVQAGIWQRHLIKIKIKNRVKICCLHQSTIAHVGDHKILGPNAAKINKKWFKELNLFFDFIEKNII